MGGIIEFEDPEWLAAGAVGEPGRRTFLVQAQTEDGDRITVGGTTIVFGRTLP